VLLAAEDARGRSPAEQPNTHSTQPRCIVPRPEDKQRKKAMGVKFYR
jgi:hypothetical protein